MDRIQGKKMLGSRAERQEQKGLLRHQISKQNQRAEDVVGKSACVWVGEPRNIAQQSSRAASQRTRPGPAWHWESEVLMEGGGLEVGRGS